MIEFPEEKKAEAARDRDLDDLLSALVDDELTAEQADQLRSRLREDPAARAAYIDALAFEALLREEFPARSETEVDVPLTLSVRPPRWGVPWFATGVAAALLVGLFGFLVSSSRSPTGALGMQSSPEGTALARVTRVTEGAHDGAQRAFVPGEILEVGDVEVHRGPVEITFNCGAVITLESGARMRLEGEQQAFLHAGKVSATVPEQAKGFVIATPRSRVLDLGTSFDLAVAENGDTDLQVLDGLVETTISDNDETKVGLIRDHEGIRITATGIERTPLSWPYTPSEIAGPEWNPVDEYVHWSFDHPAQDYFPAIAGRHRLSLVRDLEEVRDLPSRTVPGAFGGAVQFNGETETAHCRTFHGIRGDAPRTVACWVKIPEEADASHPNGIVLWGRPDLAGGMWLMNWNVRPQDGVVGALRQELGGGHVIGTTDLRDGRWHHVASVFLGGTGNKVTTHVKLYVDGRLEAVSGSMQQVVNTLTGVQDAEARPLMLGSYPDPNRMWTLEGSLDEVYVFDGALTPAQIVWLMVHNSFWLPADGWRAALGPAPR